MLCMKTNKQVLVSDCEECLSQRKALPVCFKRGFAWGVPDNKEPIWEYSRKEAERRKIDVSMYYDPNWEGNGHLRHKERIKTRYAKKSIPAEIRWAVWERDDYTCQTCGERKYLTIDHIYPESKGGELILGNLQTLCKSCNSKKGNKIEQRCSNMGKTDNRK